MQPNQPWSGDRCCNSVGLGRSPYIKSYTKAVSADYCIPEECAAARQYDKYNISNMYSFRAKCAFCFGLHTHPHTCLPDRPPIAPRWTDERRRKRAKNVRPRFGPRGGGTIVFRTVAVARFAHNTRRRLGSFLCRHYCYYL